MTALPDHQNLADMIKCRLYDLPASAAWRNRALADLLMFERVPFHAGMFTDALEAVAPDRFEFAGNCLIDKAGDDSTLPETLARVLEEYLTIATGGVHYNTEAAAVYTGLAVPTIKRHVHTTGKLQGVKWGRDLTFTPAVLDAFIATERKPGRPRKEPTSA